MQLLMPNYQNMDIITKWRYHIPTGNKCVGKNITHLRPIAFGSCTKKAKDKTQDFTVRR